MGLVFRLLLEHVALSQDFYLLGTLVLLTQFVTALVVFIVHEPSQVRCLKPFLLTDRLLPVEIKLLSRSVVALYPITLFRTDRPSVQ